MVSISSLPFAKPVHHWRCALIHAPISHALRPEGFAGDAITLLPDTGPDHFLADPFGLEEGGKIHVMAENYDYRTDRGVIDALTYDTASWKLLERVRVLDKPWHLSYPALYRWQGGIYMLPEAWKSGRLSLYRARSFPHDWVLEPAFRFDHPAIDPTLLELGGRWWMFWTPPTPKPARQSELRLSWAEGLMGPWHHEGTLLVDRSGARPGGTAWVGQSVSGSPVVHLPVQNCTQSYGGGMAILTLGGLLEGRPHVLGRHDVPIPPSLADEWGDGFHTIAAVTDSSGAAKTLVDVRCDIRSPRTAFLKKWGKLKRRFQR
ncbi:hypothetical protein E3E12_00165 [Formicincola oecophyllae]|uniref:Glucosamine inositolphosphorylceramide transferase 1 N-terminal domain-containing protein n=1 Tax=Formicincola oecophyllae TaxID=2558361 RepID=A0A4Y6U774_9PROT|nr:hypothetical protein [Formicincola oecophyllae]QDH12880.1 hypothetical protein E3E12_00165 [Formicincola oecophyllae]